MVLLDPAQAYTLHVSHESDEPKEGDDENRPKILHLKLSAAILESIVANQGGLESVRLDSVAGSNPLLLINDETYRLQATAESSPQHLYTMQVGSSNLQKVGSVSSKLSVGPESQSSSSATTRLKERRELEEARKTEHRAVLLETAPPSTRNRPVSSTSKLKLRAKGLAPASTSSPLIRSRANTPVEGYSRPGSPNLGASVVARTPPTTSPALLNIQATAIKASPLSRSVKTTSSPPSIRRRMIQLLAMGPISRRDIVQHLHQPETAVLPLLDQVGQAAPEYLQPPANITRKVNIPANRRSLAPGQAPRASQNGDRGASLLYILRDEVYRQVKINGWTEYSADDKLLVSEHMEAALKRLGIEKDAEEWKSLYPDGRAGKAKADGGPQTIDEIAAGESSLVAVESSGTPGAESVLESDNIKGVANEKQSIKKKSNQDRLKSMKRNAKARNVSRIDSPAPTASKASSTKKSKVSDAVKKDEVAEILQVKSPSSKSDSVPATSILAAKALEASPSLKPVKDAKVATDRASTNQKTVQHVKAAGRKEVEYTDSSDEDEMQVDDPPPASKRAGAEKNTIDPTIASKTASSTAISSSQSTESKRSRHGVGSGAAFSSEPWLDVRSHGDWKRLAERFKRVYQEFLTIRARLQEEEDLIKADLDLAKGEIIKSDSSLHIDDEREEGEASPVDRPLKAMALLDADPSSFANVGWRSKTTSKPMSYEELESQILKAKDLEAQLTSMRGALQTSKKALETNHVT